MKPTKEDVLHCLQKLNSDVTLQDLALHLKKGHSRSILNRIHSHCVELVAEGLVVQSRLPVGHRQFQLLFSAPSVPVPKPLVLEKPTLKQRVSSWLMPKSTHSH